MSPSRSASSTSRLRSFAGAARTSLGFIALAAAFALSSPGVRIARAGDDAAAAPVSIDPVLANAARVEKGPVPALPESSGPSCANPGPGSTLNDAMLEYQTRQLLRQMVRRVAETSPPVEPGGDQGIVLNGRGYNYPSGPR